MTEALARSAPVRLTLEEKLLIAVIVYFIALKLAFAVVAAPFADEPYYWLWGRHFALSYYDHPPLQGWLQGVSYALFGRSVFALRWMAFAALAANLWIFLLVARRVGGEAWRVFFLRSATFYLAAPLFGFFGTVAFHDYLLVTLVLGSGYFFICYFHDVETAGRGRLRDLLIGAVLLGLAALTKYNGAFLGLAVAGAVIMRPKLRPLLLGWQLYLAAAIAVAIQTPVLVWNLEHDFASFLFQMGSRHSATGFTGLNIGAIKAFAGEAMLMVSPFFVPVVILFFWARQKHPFERIGKTLAIWTFWFSTLACLYVANFSWVIWWWNIVAYVLIFPFAGRYAHGILLALHVGWGVAVSTFLTFSFTIVPVTVLFGGSAGMETERSYGLDALTAAVVAAKAESGAQFIASNHYITASQLAFLLDDAEVAELAERRTTFDDWFDQGARQGQDAIVVVEPNTDTEYWRGAFTEITDLGEVRAERFGYLINTYRLFLGRGFVPLDGAQRGK
jgi:4-amino-4-deoxy-L-arabinose transferase-like glycosyltransferase